jgi:citrate lyase subunit beta/citryl-CoA lyase
MTTDTRPLRSALYMPASNDRAMAKARSLDCDAVVLDLEDAVAPDSKAQARAALVREAQAGGFGYRRLVARCNGTDGPWGQDDLAALASAPVEAVLAPKVQDAADIVALSLAMDRAGFVAHVSLWVMIETPRAALAVERIADCAATTRLSGMVLGLNDLAKDTGMAQAPGRAAFMPLMAQSVLAARANGLVVLDGVCNAIDDADLLEAECTQARAFGFDGKTLIHPAQLAVANRVFAPAQSELAEAEAIVTAFADPANAGVGAVRVNGKMAERLHCDMAERLIARAQAIASRG